MSNGPENTVTFSYFTHLLLFLFQTVKADAMFLFLAKVTSGHCFSPSNNAHFEGQEDFILSPKWTAGLKHL